MLILILGGTRFLSRRVASEALARDHNVVCAARGVHGVPPDGATFVAWDRACPVPAALASLRPDAVVDVTDTPALAARAVAQWPGAHWVFVSTLNVYADISRPGDAANTPLVAPRDDADDDMEAYGAMKVACENAVRGGARRCLVLRPGLIVGPDDPSGRFAYWPAHAAAAAEDGGGLLVPGSPGDPVQFVDVRDLAAWVVRAVGAGTTGCLDAVGPSMRRAEFVDGLARGVGRPLDVTYAPPGWLAAHDVHEWWGARSLPLWVADPAADGMMARDVTASLAAGLTVRPVADTVRDTLAWLRQTPDAYVTGLTRDEELTLLAQLRRD